MPNFIAAIIKRIADAQRRYWEGVVRDRDLRNTQRTIQTLWFWRKGESSPELLVAWDDFSVDENPEGFEAECARTYEQVRSSDAYGPRRITLSVDERAITDAFAPPTVRSIVESS